MDAISLLFGALLLVGWVPQESPASKGSVDPQAIDDMQRWKCIVEWLATTDPLEFDFAISNAGPATDYDPVADKPIEVAWRERDLTDGRFGNRAAGIEMIEFHWKPIRRTAGNQQPIVGEPQSMTMFRKNDAVAVAGSDQYWTRLELADFGCESTNGARTSGFSTISTNLLVALGPEGRSIAFRAKGAVCLADPRELTRTEKPQALASDFKIEPRLTTPPGGMSCRIPAAKARGLVDASLSDATFPREPGEHTDGYMTLWLGSDRKVESIRIVVQDFIHGGMRPAGVPRSKEELADPEVARLNMLETVIWFRHPRKPSEEAVPVEVQKLLSVAPDAKK